MTDKQSMKSLLRARQRSKLYEESKRPHEPFIHQDVEIHDIDKLNEPSGDEIPKLENTFELDKLHRPSTQQRTFKKEETGYSEPESPYLRVHTLLGSQSVYMNNEPDKLFSKNLESTRKSGERIPLLTKEADSNNILERSDRSTT